ncbi:hypothetical protein GCM10007981_09330 [Thermocladium modestius]|uniref:Uncharacterized protein n=1 Tax=Thermocladium modestius TaxID=62609 RepID=A0A830GY21_9CREN|nr:hypothetical protein GCM10007981_09330 [Thermocladium modestius]
MLGRFAAQAGTLIDVDEKAKRKRMFLILDTYTELRSALTCIESAVDIRDSVKFIMAYISQYAFMAFWLLPVAVSFSN